MFLKLLKKSRIYNKNIKISKFKKLLYFLGFIFFKFFVSHRRWIGRRRDHLHSTSPELSDATSGDCRHDLDATLSLLRMAL